MKSVLKTLSLALAIGVPTSLLAQIGGAQLPRAVEADTLFIAFVTTLTLLTIVSDYTRPVRHIQLPQARGSAEAEIIQLRAMPSPVRLAA